MTSFFIHIANAAAAALPNSGITNAGGIQTLLCSVVGYFFWIVMVISIIMIIWAGFTYATAGDDTEKTSKARRTITYAAIGIIVAVLASQFPTIIGTIFPNSTGVQPACSSGSGAGSTGTSNGSTSNSTAYNPYGTQQPQP